MLKVDIKSNKSGKWETTARATALEAAKYCEDFDEFIRYFTSVLSNRKRDSTGHISDSYKARRSAMVDAQPHKVFILHTPASGKVRVIVEVTEGEPS